MIYIYIHIHREYFPQKAPMSWPPWLLLLWSRSSKYFRCKLCLHRYRQCTSWSRPPRLPKECWGEWVFRPPRSCWKNQGVLPPLTQMCCQLQGFSGRSFFQLQGPGGPSKISPSSLGDQSCHTSHHLLEMMGLVYKNISRLFGEGRNKILRW